MPPSPRIGRIVVFVKKLLRQLLTPTLERRKYLPHVEGRANLLDLGCGRGEFLDLLRESGVPARGVDVDLDMVVSCRNKGLDVAMQHVFAHLDGAADDLLGGVFGAQLIEHLPPHRIVELVQICHQQLAAGGVLTLATPNPTSLMALAQTCSKRLSRVQPLHPDTLESVLETAGFQQVQVEFSAPFDPAVGLPLADAPDADPAGLTQVIERLNARLCGSRDYAVVGHTLASRRVTA
jgi:O-antigen chain-terminating methyltransferase